MKAIISARNIMKLCWYALCFFLVVPALLSGCACGVEIDRSVLTDDPCAAPCWNNITPGVSNEDDVRTQLENSPLVRKNTLAYSTTEQQGVPLKSFCWRDQSKERNWIYLRDGKVSWITIDPDYDLALGEVVGKYGPPEAFAVYLARSGFLRYSIILNYPSQGLQFSTSLHPADPNEADWEKSMILSENILITNINYFAPTTLEGLLGEVFLLQSETVEALIADTQEWRGFGRVDVIDR